MSDERHPISEPLKVVELFAGIGSPRKAISNLGIPHTSIISEIDAYAAQSYCAVHGDTVNLGDITKVAELPDCDILIDGSPCQSISKEGRNTGMKRGSGTQSSLKWETIRLLRAAEELPKVIIQENVPNILSKRHRKDLNAVISELSDMGYHSNYAVLNAQNFGLPQNRNRFFLVSRLECGFIFPQIPQRTGLKLKDILESDVSEDYYLTMDEMARFVHSIPSKDRVNINNPTKKGYITAEDGDGIILAFPSSMTKRGRVQKGSSPTLLTKGDAVGVVLIDSEGVKIRKLTELEFWRLQGFMDSDYRAAAQTCSSTQLYKQAGNSIPVSILEWLISAVLVDRSTTIRQTSMSDFAICEEAIN